MHNKAYKQTIDWLFQQFPSYQQLGGIAYKPTLINTNLLIDKLKIDFNKLNFIHVAGSNGKGTVSSLLASICAENNITTGLFTSPHIKDFRERIRVNGQCITEDGVIRFVDRLRLLKLDFEPSFFEITFVMALDHFIEKNCGLCVIETGLGGRLDSTNVITPLLSIITTISLEHTQFLGNTPEEIAMEKGGIIKEKIPVVIGEGALHQLKVFKNIALEKKSELIQSDPDLDLSSYRLPFLPTSYQLANFRTTLAALTCLRQKDISIDKKAIQMGLDHLNENSGYRGRLQIVSHRPLLIYDASHNAEGIEATLKAVNSVNKGVLHLIYGTSADKDLGAIIAILPEQARYYLTEFNNPRSAKIDHLAHSFNEKNLVSIAYFTEPEKALKTALSDSAESDTILVIGSFFLLEHFF